MNDKIAILGYSGHSFVIIEEYYKIGYSISGYLDLHEKEYNPYNLKYLGNEQQKEVTDYLSRNNFKFFNSIGDNKIRRTSSEMLMNKGLKTINVISMSSIISSTASIEEGTFVSSNVVVNAMTKINRGSILNTGCIIEHDCKVGAYTHIAPKAVLLGNVSVDENSLIGGNSVVRPGITIGKNCIVGAGSVVVRDIPDNEIWVGNPAKRIK